MYVLRTVEEIEEERNYKDTIGKHKEKIALTSVVHLEFKVNSTIYIKRHAYLLQACDTKEHGGTHTCTKCE